MLAILSLLALIAPSILAFNKPVPSLNVTAFLGRWLASPGLPSLILEVSSL